MSSERVRVVKIESVLRISLWGEEIRR